MTRGARRKLLPTCQRRTAKRIAAAQAFQNEQDGISNANAQKTAAQLNATTQPASNGQPQEPRGCNGKPAKTR
jgi:hypothetical protein